MEFLELLDTVEAEKADASKLFAGEGTRVRGRSRKDPKYLGMLAEALRLVNDARSGRRIETLREAMTTSDFPLLFGDILDRQLLAGYADWPVSWPGIARRATVRDFRNVSRFTVDGAEGALTKVKERTEYPAAKLTEGRFQYGVAKYGRRLPFMWEDFINDDLGALENSPQRLAKAARVTEERFVTNLFAGNFTGGSAFFRSANSNVITANMLGFTNSANPALTITALQIAFAVLAAQVDADGNPILVDRVHLIVPPALMVQANNIVNSTEIVAPPGSGGTNVQSDVLHTANWVKNRLDVMVNPWLPIIDATQGNSAWYLFADAGESRPTMELGFLRGHETPEMFMKSPNATRIGGGTVAAEDGDFDTDSVEYKVRHVIGGSLLDVKGAVGSKGTNA
jgi:hypothetical protein